LYPSPSGMILCVFVFICFPFELFLLFSYSQFNPNKTKNIFFCWCSFILEFEHWVKFSFVLDTLFQTVIVDVERVQF
jgi:hypothetical protein